MVFCVNYILNHIYLRALKRFDMVHTIVPPFDILGLQIDIFEATKKSFLLKSYQQQATNDCTNKLAAIAPQYRLRLPSCDNRFESQAHNLCFFRFVLLKL